MPSKPVDPDDLQKCVDAYHLHGNKVAAAQALGIPVTTFNHRFKLASAAEFHPKQQKPFALDPLPDPELSAEELLENRIKQFARRREADTARKLVPIRVKIDGPIGIVHLGDPHVDDDGTDLRQLRDHVNIVNKTEGLFGASVGDYSNNWTGRLSRLYAEQSTSAQQAWVLVEWLIKSTDWIYLVAGNHDLWSGAGDPIKWMIKQAHTLYEPWGTRIALQFPNAKQVRINCRHDFSGHSQWNPVHGASKAIQMGWRDHILTCGHKHTSHIQGPFKDPSSGLLSWAIRVAGYKIMDRYAQEKGLPDQNAFPACVTIIDPRYDDDDTRLVTVIPDVAEGAEFLQWKRKKKTA
jgi:hypothetical protein